jgi:hypothetical protein
MSDGAHMSNFSVLDSILMPSAVKAEYSGTPDSMNPIGSYPDAAHTEKETLRKCRSAQGLVWFASRSVSSAHRTSSRALPDQVRCLGLSNVSGITTGQGSTSDHRRLTHKAVARGVLEDQGVEVDVLPGKKRLHVTVRYTKARITEGLRFGGQVAKCPALARFPLHRFPSCTCQPDV